MVEMGYRSWRRLLWTTSIVLAAGIVCVVCAAVFMPLDLAATREPALEDGGRAKAKADPSVKKMVPLERYAVVYERDLRKPLFDPAVVRPPDSSKPKRKLTVTLVGTAVDPGLTYGIFRDSHGKTVLARIGQKIEDAEVVSVEEGSATVKFDGETITLSLPGREKKP
jgi:hypothetical protein